MCPHFEFLFTSERSSSFLGVFFWGISISGVVFIFGAVFIGIPKMNKCALEYVQNFEILFIHNRPKQTKMACSRGFQS